MLKPEERKQLENWRVQSPETPGFHKVVVPETCECRELRIFRLNLPRGQGYRLNSGELELHTALIHGEARLSGNPKLSQPMKRFDSFYIPAGDSVGIEAVEDCVFYIAGAVYEGIGEACFRAYDPSLPIGDLHQVHGAGVARREVMFTLPPQTPASRLICGLTWGGEGAWTSWPPHQHEKDLEEVYCYFDMDSPRFGLHLSYLASGEVEDIVAHVVKSGTMVQAPRGYHPTVGSPGTVNTYFWALASFRPEGRRYDLAIEDPAYAKPRRGAGTEVLR